MMGKKRGVELIKTSITQLNMLISALDSALVTWVGGVYPYLFA